MGATLWYFLRVNRQNFKEWASWASICKALIYAPSKFKSCSLAVCFHFWLHESNDNETTHHVLISHLGCLMNWVLSTQVQFMPLWMKGTKCCWHGGKWAISIWLIHWMLYCIVYQGILIHWIGCCQHKESMGGLAKQWICPLIYANQAQIIS